MTDLIAQARTMIPLIEAWGDIEVEFGREGQGASLHEAAAILTALVEKAEKQDASLKQIIGLTTPDTEGMK